MLRANSYSPAFNPAVGTTEPYRGTDHTVAVMIQLAKGLVDPRALVAGALQGERSIRYRRHTEQIINNLRPKDYTSEIIAISRWWGNAGRYTRDPLHVELIRSPDRLLDDALAGRLLVDCFPEGTLVLRDDYTFLPIEHARSGDKIWGYDKWSTVTSHEDKGHLPIDAIKLNNGSWLKLTPDHKVYVRRCPKHPNDVQSHAADGKPKFCWCKERETVRIRVSELHAGHVMLVPDRIPFGTGEMDPDRAYVEGLYLSDGWCQQSRFNISGQDGCPKEEQKREVEAICARLGIGTTWHRKSLEIHGAEWADRMATMGTHAPQKHAPTINLSEGAAVPLLRGIMADSGANTSGGNSRTFTTTSRQLMLQTRVLHRMLGISCGYSYIEDHGGLGENPIWRLSTRQPTHDHATKMLRVKEIVRNAAVARCYDIATDDHYVYLPEHDVTVSNCDDLALAIATSCMTIGARAQFVTVGFRPQGFGPKIHTHVFARAQDPKSKVWWVLDPVAGRKTGDMLRRVKQYTIFEVD